MAEESKIEKWLAFRRSGEMERIRALEEEVAKAWWNSLSLEQREVYAELEESGHGLHHLHFNIREARWAARKRRRED
jgi:hypothetical protein